MATLVCYKKYPDTSRKFRTGGMDFDLSIMFDSLNKSLFDGEIQKLEFGRIFVPNPQTEFGLEIVATMFGEHTMAVTDGKRIIIHPFITTHSFPLDATTITKVLLHEMVHVLDFQRHGKIHEHKSFFFGSTVAQINERLGMPETERDQLKFWPKFPIPLFDLLAWRVRLHMRENARKSQLIDSLLDVSDDYVWTELPDTEPDIVTPLGDDLFEVQV